MNRNFIAAIAEAFKMAALYSDNQAVLRLAEMLELGFHPDTSKQLVYYLTYKSTITQSLDTATIEALEENLVQRTR